MDKRMSAFVLCLAALVLAAASVAGTLYIPILVGDAIDAVVGPLFAADAGPCGREHGAFCGDGCGAHRGGGGLSHLPYPQ